MEKYKRQELLPFESSFTTYETIKLELQAAWFFAYQVKIKMNAHLIDLSSCFQVTFALSLWEFTAQRS